MSLTTLSSVKAQGGIATTDSSRDSQLRSLIDGISSLVRAKLHRDLESQVYTEYYSGDGSSFLLLRQYPVTSVALVCVDDAGYFGFGPGGFSSTQNLTEGVDFALVSGGDGQGSSGMLRRIGGIWSRNRSRAVGIIQDLPGLPSGNIKVRYTAGFVVIPPAISMAVNSAVLKLLATATVGGGVSQMGYEDASVGFLSPTESAALFGSIESVLACYQSVPI